MEGFGSTLLLPQHQGILDIIAKDHPSDTLTCCKRMLKKWLETTTDATWNQLLSALRSPIVQLGYYYPLYRTAIDIYLAQH